MRRRIAGLKLSSGGLILVIALSLIAQTTSAKSAETCEAVFISSDQVFSAEDRAQVARELQELYAKVDHAREAGDLGLARQLYPKLQEAAAKARALRIDIAKLGATAITEAEAQRRALAKSAARFKLPWTQVSSLSTDTHGSAQKLALFPNGEKILYAVNYAVNTGKETSLKTRIIEIKTGKILKESELPRYQNFAIDPTGSFILSYDDGKAPHKSYDEKVKAASPPRIWNAKTLELIATLDGQKEWVEAAAISPDGALVATGSKDQTIKVWSAKSGQELIKMELIPGGEVKTLAFSHNGELIASGAADGTARIWDAKTGAELARIRVANASWVTSLSFSPDDTFLMTESSKTLLQIWRWNTLEKIGQLGIHQFGTMHPTQYVWHPTKSQFAVSDWNMVRLFDAGTMEVVSTFFGHDKKITNLKFTRDGQHLITGSEDKTLRTWELATGDELARAMAEQPGSFLNDFHFDANDSVIVSRHFDAIRFWQQITPP